MSIINTGSFSSDLLPLVKNWFGASYKDMPLYFNRIMKVESTSTNYQVDAIVDTLGLLQRKNEGSALTYDSSKEAHKPTYQPVAYALGFIITKEAMDDGLAMLKAKNFTEQFKMGALQTRETICANVYNNAFSGSYLMTNGDGVCMISNAHPTHGTTQSNLITGGSVDISEAALEQLRQDIRNAKNHRGLRAGIMPDKLICSVSDEAAANRILRSDKRVATADNDLNFLRENNTIPGGIVANPYLSDSDAFFVTTSATNGVKLLVREEPNIDQSGDFDSKNAKFSVMMRIVAGWTDHRGVYGSAGV